MHYPYSILRTHCGFKNFHLFSLQASLISQISSRKISTPVSYKHKPQKNAAALTFHVHDMKAKFINFLSLLIQRRFFAHSSIKITAVSE
jgi:hypothetical protein